MVMFGVRVMFRVRVMVNTSQFYVQQKQYALKTRSADGLETVGGVLSDLRLMMCLLVVQEHTKGDYQKALLSLCGGDD